jgi:hypothetical protein
MESLADREAPPPAAGPEIPVGVRSVVLKSMSVHYSATVLWRDLKQYQGWHDVEDAAADIERRWKEGAGVRVIDAVNAYLKRNISLPHGTDRMAEPALHSIPASLFLDAVQMALVDTLSGYRGLVVQTANELFERRGIHYRVLPSGEVKWHGDGGAYRAVIRPALDALSDPRLATPRKEFENGVAALRRDSQDARKSAIRESAAAVESAMKIILDENGVSHGDKLPASKMIELLVSHKIVERRTDSTLQAPSRYRNQFGGHGAGAADRFVPSDETSACVLGAATALVFLAAKLR